MRAWVSQGRCGNLAASWVGRLPTQVALGLGMGETRGNWWPRTVGKIPPSSPMLVRGHGHELGCNRWLKVGLIGHCSYLVTSLAGVLVTSGTTTACRTHRSTLLFDVHLRLSGSELGGDAVVVRRTTPSRFAPSRVSRRRGPPRGARASWGSLCHVFSVDPVYEVALVGLRHLEMVAVNATWALAGTGIRAAAAGDCRSLHRWAHCSWRDSPGHGFAVADACRDEYGPRRGAGLVGDCGECQAGYHRVADPRHAAGNHCGIREPHLERRR